MAEASITANIFQPGNILGDLPTQLAFHRIFFVQDGSEAGQFIFAQFFGPSLGVHPRTMTQLPGNPGADSVDIGQSDNRRLIARDVHA
jgi:hypothetical protein